MTAQAPALLLSSNIQMTQQYKTFLTLTQYIKKKLSSLPHGVLTIIYRIQNTEYRILFRQLTCITATGMLLGVSQAHTHTHTTHTHTHTHTTHTHTDDTLIEDG